MFLRNKINTHQDSRLLNTVGINDVASLPATNKLPDIANRF